MLKLKVKTIHSSSSYFSIYCMMNDDKTNSSSLYIDNMMIPQFLIKKTLTWYTTYLQKDNLEIKAHDLPNILAILSCDLPFVSGIKMMAHIAQMKQLTLKTKRQPYNCMT